MVTDPKHHDDWEDLAREDPMWAVLSDPSKKHAWMESDFFLTGEEEIQAVLAKAGGFGLPVHFNSALDFGCGLGRLTRALAAHFNECWGIDISETMIRKAKSLVPEGHFVTNVRADLSLFSDEYFDLIYSALVLQHLPAPRDIAKYIQEFLRVLRPGGISIFQVPSYLAPIHRIQPRRRLYGILRSIGFAPSLLLQMRLDPMRATFLPFQRVCQIIERNHCKLISCEQDNCVPGGTSCTYYVGKP